MTPSGAAPPATSDPILRLTQVVKEFPVKMRGFLRRSRERVHAVSDVSLDVTRGETLGLVGETGCGKTTLARCMLRVHDVTSGSIVFDGQDITTATGEALRPYRRRMQMVFQDPFGSLNPRRRVGAILADPFEIHRVGSAADRKGRVQGLMARVGLNPEHYNRFPAEFSGGERQRIGIARAIALDPALVVCDEPVSALDVSIRAQILNLLTDLQKTLGLTYVFISHDLSVVRHVSDRVAVMYLGRIVELARADDLYLRPRHPYTRALLSAVPVPDPDAMSMRDRTVLSGDPPSPVDPPSGCGFHPRCPRAQAVCATEVPALIPRLMDDASHIAACHFPLADGEKLTPPSDEDAPA